MRIKYLLFIPIFTLFFTSCGSHKRIVKNHKKKDFVIKEPKQTNLPSVHQVQHVKKLKGKRLNAVTLSYIKKYAPIAVKEMQKYKIPASITLAQGILESGSGKGALAMRSNNHFGIKCHTKWKGDRVHHDDDKKGECFRKYTYVETSYEDHSKFLSSRKRYASLFKLKKNNYKAWAKALKKAGYATDKKYPQKLIKIIEDYRLYEFDTYKKEKNNYQKKTNQHKKKTSKKQYIVKQGDTLYGISKRFGLTVSQLKKRNGLLDNNLKIGQVLLLE